jgi:hypothetical protein
MAVAKADILHLYGVRTGNNNPPVAFRGDSVKRNVLNSGNMRVFSVKKADFYGQRHVIHNDIGKPKILHNGRFSAEIGLNKPFVGNIKKHSNAGVGHNEIAKNAVTNSSVANERNPNSCRRGSHIAIDNGNLLANFILLKRPTVGANDNAIVTARNIAVGNGNVSATIDVNTVVVGII